jgi:hypothetical protein
MNNPTRNRAIVIAIAGAVALGTVSPSWAAPVLSSTTIVKESAPSAVSDVRYRGNRGHYYRNSGAGIALGVLGVVGAVAGAAAYGNGYYGGPGYARQGYYGGYDGYAYEPGYVVAPRRYHGHSNCVIEGAYRPDYSMC